MRISKDTSGLGHVRSVLEWSQLLPEELFRRLHSMTVDEALALAPEAPALLNALSDPEGQAALIRVCGPYWPKSNLKALSRLLFGDHLAVRVAVLDLLVRIAPGQLLDFLPRLLTSDQTRIRSLAIRGLFAIDQDEALAHLDLLLRGNPEERHAGIQCAFLLPFPQVKPLILDFLLRERDPDLCRQAGLLFVSNPDLEVPFRLWDMIGRRGGENEDLFLRKLVREVCAAIDGTGQMGAQFADYEKKLQDWVFRREGTRFLQKCVNRLEEAPEEPSTAVLAVIEQQIRHPVMRDLVREATQWPLSGRVREQLVAMLAGPETARPATQGTPPPTDPTETATLKHPPGPEPIPTPAEIRSMSDDEAITRISSLDDNPGGALGRLLLDVLGDTSHSAALRASSLRKAQEIGYSSLVGPARQTVSSVDANLAGASLNYLAQFDPDGAFPFLGKFLSSSNLRLKTAAIRILQRFDPDQAISRLESLLKNDDPVQQQLALACLVQFDFALVRPLLGSFMRTVPEPKLLQACLSLFLANPDPDNLYHLFCLERTLPGERGTEVLSVRRKTESLLEEMGRLPEASKKRDHDMQTRWEHDQAKENKTPAPYSVKALKPRRSMGEQAAESVAAGLVTATMATFTLVKWGLILGIVGALVGGFLVVRNLFESKRSEIIIGSPIRIEGTVAGRDQTTKYPLLDVPGRGRFILVPDAEGFPVERMNGRKLQAQVVPVRIQVDMVVAEIQEWAPIADDHPAPAPAPTPKEVPTP